MMGIHKETRNPQERETQLRTIKKINGILTGRELELGELVFCIWVFKESI